MRGKLRVGVLLMSVAGVVSGGPADGVVLPSPRTDGGMALMEALRTRHSTREFSTRVLPPQVLSDLLWAAAGVSRPESGKRTAPSARDWREIDVYVALADGALGVAWEAGDYAEIVFARIGAAELGLGPAGGPATVRARAGAPGAAKPPEVAG